MRDKINAVVHSWCYIQQLRMRHSSLIPSALWDAAHELVLLHIDYCNALYVNVWLKNYDNYSC